MNQHARLRFQGRLSSLLLIMLVALLGYLSGQYHVRFDMTATGRNSLSQASIDLLQQLKEPVRITVFAKDQSSVRSSAKELIGRYQERYAAIELRWVDPDREPQRVREQGIRVEGTLLIEVGGRQEKLEQLDEQSLTNALIRLQRGAKPTLSFVQGHGERRPNGQANHDLSTWVKELQARGFLIKETTLGAKLEAGNEASVLVLSQPQTELLPGEVEVLLQYLTQGGNLLWLAEPGPQRGLEPVQELLGVKVLPGTLVDLVGQLLANNAALTVATVESYHPHPLLRGFDLQTLFPFAAGLGQEPAESWQATELITTTSGWSETGDIGAEVAYDPDSDIKGPLPLAIAFTRRVEGRAQRVIVIGDGDFLSNSYLGNGGNLQLAMNMVNWLSADESFLNIAPLVAGDLTLNFTRMQMLLIGGGFLLLLPLALALYGAVICWKRKRL